MTKYVISSGFYAENETSERNFLELFPQLTQGLICLCSKQSDRWQICPDRQKDFSALLVHAWTHMMAKIHKGVTSKHRLGSHGGLFHSTNDWLVCVWTQREENWQPRSSSHRVHVLVDIDTGLNHALVAQSKSNSGQKRQISCERNTQSFSLSHFSSIICSSQHRFSFQGISGSTLIAYHAIWCKLGIPHDSITDLDLHWPFLTLQEEAILDFQDFRLSFKPGRDMTISHASHRRKVDVFVCLLPHSMWLNTKSAQIALPNVFNSCDITPGLNQSEHSKLWGSVCQVPFLCKLTNYPCPSEVTNGEQMPTSISEWQPHNLKKSEETWSEAISKWMHW